MSNLDAEIRKQREARVAFGAAPQDADRDQFDTSIAAGDEDVVEDPFAATAQKRGRQWTAPKSVLEDIARADKDVPDPFEATRRKTIAERESDYQAKGRARRMALSPERADPFADKTPAPHIRTYKDSIQDVQLAKERKEVMDKIAKKKKEEEEAQAERKRKPEEDIERPSRRGKWDEDEKSEQTAKSERPARGSRWDATPARVEQEQKSSRSRWDATPAQSEAPARGSRWDATPAASDVPRSSRWDATPAAGPSKWDATPLQPAAGKVQEGETPKRAARSRWDETPVGIAPGMMTPGATPVGGWDMMTPTPEQLAQMTPEQLLMMRQV